MKILVLFLGIVKASLEILGIGIGVKKLVLLRSDVKSTESLNYTILVSGAYLLVLSMYDTSSDGLSLVTVV